MEEVKALTRAVENLGNETTGLREDLLALRREMRRRTAIGLSVVVAFILFSGALGYAVVDNRRRIAESEAKSCPIIRLQIGPDAPAPSTLRGRQLVADAEELARSYNCPEN